MTTDGLVSPPDAGTTSLKFCATGLHQTERDSCLKSRVVRLEFTNKMEDKASKDPLMERIGTHGKFQLRTFLIIQFVGVFVGWQLLVS